MSTAARYRVYGVCTLATRKGRILKPGRQKFPEIARLKCGPEGNEIGRTVRRRINACADERNVTGTEKESKTLSGVSRAGNRAQTRIAIQLARCMNFSPYSATRPSMPPKGAFSAHAKRHGAPNVVARTGELKKSLAFKTGLEAR
jgi:hypothetical protein